MKLTIGQIEAIIKFIIAALIGVIVGLITNSIGWGIVAFMATIIWAS